MIFWRILAMVSACLLAYPAQAQKTKATLNTEISVLIPDNNAMSITPFDLRSVTSDMVNSILPTAPVVNGNLACFDGTTGLLKDCAVSPSNVSLTVGTTAIIGGTPNKILFDSSGTVGELAVTGSGNAVLSTSPTLVTPILGAASATTINGLSIVSANSQANIGLGTPLSTQIITGNNVIIGNANAFTSADQNVIVGTGGTGASLTVDSGNVLVGWDVAPSLHNGSIPTNFMVAIGNSAARGCISCGSDVYIGRASGVGATTDDHSTGVGHASLFTGSGNSQVTAIGDSAGGAQLTGDAIPSGFPNTGLSVFPFNGDTNLECIGEHCGKATTAARKQSFSVGSYARIPARDNVGVLGNGLQAVETSGRSWDGTSVVTLNANSGQTWTCAQLLGGILTRTGSIGGAFNEQVPTAQAIVQCATGGVGNNSEVPVSVPFSYFNNGTGGTATIITNTGITLSGVSATVANATGSMWRVIVTNSTPSSEAVTLYRLQ